MTFLVIFYLCFCLAAWKQQYDFGSNSTSPHCQVLGFSQAMTNDKPPSLAGVEKFFRSRPVGGVNAADPADLRKSGDDHDDDDDHLDSAPDSIVPTAEAAV